MELSIKPTPEELARAKEAARIMAEWQRTIDSVNFIKSMGEKHISNAAINKAQASSEVHSE